MRSFMMFTAFKMCKGIAQKYHFELMYDFIQDGFSAMKPLKSADLLKILRKRTPDC